MTAHGSSNLTPEQADAWEKQYGIRYAAVSEAPFAVSAPRRTWYVGADGRRYFVDEPGETGLSASRAERRVQKFGGKALKRKRRQR